MSLISQSDTLNNRNSKGRKDGYWLQYLNKNITPTDSLNSYFYAYELYDNGQKVFTFDNLGRLKQKDIPKYDTSSLVKGKPQILNSTIEWYSIKENILTRQEKYRNGLPIQFKSYRRNWTIGGPPDTTNYLVEFFDFEKKFNQMRGSYYYVFYFNNKPVKQFWFRKVKGHWKMKKTKAK